MVVGCSYLPRLEGQLQSPQGLFIVSTGFAHEVDLFSERHPTDEEPGE